MATRKQLATRFKSAKAYARASAKAAFFRQGAKQENMRRLKAAGRKSTGGSGG